MRSLTRERGTATVADLMAIPADERFHELLAGEIVRKATPSGEHGDAQSALVVDPMEASLSVFRSTPDGYPLVLAADREARVRAEPFEAVDLSVGALFGAEDAED